MNFMELDVETQGWVNLGIIHAQLARVKDLRLEAELYGLYENVEKCDEIIKQLDNLEAQNIAVMKGLGINVEFPKVEL